MGPGLGGGHGRYEGIHGLIGDNLVDMNVVLADGSAIKVNDKTHADLFWGMRGAGHNFGIVTSFEMKIYPKILETWHYHNYYWTADKLEGVFKALNKFHNNGNTPVLMAVNYGGYWWNPNVTDTEVRVNIVQLWETQANTRKRRAFTGYSDMLEMLLMPKNFWSLSTKFQPLCLSKAMCHIPSWPQSRALDWTAHSVFPTKSIL